MAKITIDTIEHIATLARLALTDEEKGRYAEQLSAVLESISLLDEVPTDTVLETCQVTGQEDVLRDDMVFPCDDDTRRKLIQQFPEHLGDLLKVQGVFGDQN